MYIYIYTYTHVYTYTYIYIYYNEIYYQMQHKKWDDLFLSGLDLQNCPQNRPSWRCDMWPRHEIWLSKQLQKLTICLLVISWHQLTHRWFVHSFAIQLFGVQSLTVACDVCVHNQQSWTHHHKSWGIKKDWVRQRPSEFFMFFPSSLRFWLYIVVSGTWVLLNMCWFYRLVPLAHQDLW